MFTADELEELFKSEQFAKSVNRRALNSLFQHTKMLRDTSLTDDQRKQVMENIKAITHNLEPKPISLTQKDKSKPKKTNKPSIVSSTQKQQPDAAPIKIEPEDHPFPEDFASHHGTDPVKFKNAWRTMSPEQRKTTLDWHNEQKALKVAPQTDTMKKSIDELYALLLALRTKI